MKIDTLKMCAFFFQMVFGIYLYYALASLPNVETFKLYNVVGLSLDILGVLILSKFIMGLAEKNNFIEMFYDAMFFGLYFLILGFYSGDFFLFWLDLPSINNAHSLTNLSLYLVLCPLALIDMTRCIKGLNIAKYRLHVMGVYILILGLSFQMVGSIMDLSN